MIQIGKTLESQTTLTAKGEISLMNVTNVMKNLIPFFTINLVSIDIPVKESPFCEVG